MSSKMTNDELIWRINELKLFKKASQKTHFICKCNDTCIFVLSELTRNFLKNRFKIQNKKRICRKLFPLRFNLRKLADAKISIKEKRQILINIGVKALVYPIFQKILIPMLEHKVKVK